jgi:DNA-binding Lrp family transcriptional regulator
MPVDETDRKIIAVLDRNASLTHKEIAQKLGMNESTVRKRILALQENKVIKYIVQITTSQIGYKTEAALGVDVDPAKMMKAGKKLGTIEGVRMVFSTSGEHDFWVVIWTTDRESLSKIIDRIAAIDGITQVIPSVLVERLK